MSTCVSLWADIAGHGQRELTALMLSGIDLRILMIAVGCTLPGVSDARSVSLCDYHHGADNESVTASGKSTRG
jgi:hypothetical protein